MIMSRRAFDIGDKVICVTSGVIGVAVRFYIPTACGEQTMVVTTDGRRYHAPSWEWRKVKDE